MGRFPATVLGVPGRRRGDHPLCSFTAVGPLSDPLIDSQSADRVYAPLEELASRDGWVLLIGVGLDRMTLIHLAEQRAGRHLLQRWANGPDGRVRMFPVGSCSAGFPALDRLLAPFERTTVVGASLWRAFRSRPALDVAAEAIRTDPRITHCGRACQRCDDIIAGGPLVG